MKEGREGRKGRKMKEGKKKGLTCVAEAPPLFAEAPPLFQAKENPQFTSLFLARPQQHIKEGHNIKEEHK